MGGSVGGETLEKGSFEFCLQVGESVFVEGVVCSLAKATDDLLAAETMKEAGHCEDFNIDIIKFIACVKIIIFIERNFLSFKVKKSFMIMVYM